MGRGGEEEMRICGNVEEGVIGYERGWKWVDEMSVSFEKVKFIL